MKHLYYEHHCKKYDWTLFVKVGFVHFSYLGGGGGMWSWVVNWDLSSSMYQIRYMDWIVRRGQLMGNRAFDRVSVHAGPYYLVHSLVARQCHGLYTNYVFSAVDHRALWPSASCICDHKWGERGHSADLPVDLIGASLWGVYNRGELHWSQLCG